MLNESAHVDHLVADIAKQDFEGAVELIVADGGSTDDSPELLRAAADRNGVALEVLDNPAGWVSHALNACVKAAKGDLLVRLDCHSRYPSDYLRRCAVAAEETDALVVGGVIVAERRTLLERAVACAMYSPFGGIGFYRLFTPNGRLAGRLSGTLGIAWARRDGLNARVDADTVTFGAFRPEAFNRAGLFDEALRRNQDDELNLRIRKAGGRVVLDLSIRVHYTPRGSLRGVFRQYHGYGLWKVPVMRKHRQVANPRSLAPIAFVSSVALLAALAPQFRLARQLLLAELGAYGALALGFGASSVRRRRESWGLLPRVVAVFPTFHTAYGLGMVRGWLSAARAKR